MKSWRIEILQVDDSPEDVELIQEALREQDLEFHLNAVEDGQEAMAYLRQEGAYAGAARPDIILLDLNLPRKDGRETLTEIKQTPDLCDIPVIVLTTSDRDQDILECYRSHANCFIKKPADLERFIEIMAATIEFWFSVVKLPRDNPDEKTVKFP